jgi:sugar (pentulose or hexulose) kinase
MCGDALVNEGDVGMIFKNYLIFDFGAGSGRAMVAQFDGKKFFMTEVYRFDNSPVYMLGTLYWDVLRLVFELKNGIRLANKKFKNIHSISVDTWALDFGFIDKRGKLLANPIHYRDERRNSIFNEVYKIISKEKLFMLTGASILTVMSIFNMYALIVENAPELQSAHKFLMMPDIFNFFLSGNAVNEFTNATSTVMFNQKERQWEDVILKKFDVPMNLFPKMVFPGTNIGTTQTSINKELEIKPMQVIVPATWDASSSITGIPVINLKKKWAYLSLGTWGAIGVETNEPLIDKRIFESGYANLGEAGGLNSVWKAITGFWIIQQCRIKWINERGEDLAWDDIVQNALSAEDFNAFINVDDTVFGKTHTDMPMVIMNYCKKTGQAIPTTLGEVACCVYKSLAMKFRDNLDILKSLLGESIELLYIVGGGAKNKLLCQWTANLTGMQIFACQIETTSIGSLIMQLVSDNEIKNIEDGRVIAKNSMNIDMYEPKDINKWDDLYSKYLKIKNKK